MIRAVVFDLGGVILDSPLETFLRWEGEQGLPPGTLGRVVVATGASGAWSQLERGELTLASFCQAFDVELAAAGASVSSADLMAEVARTSRVRPVMLSALASLRERGLKLGALTNNWPWGLDGDPLEPLRPAFDAFVESYKVGLRKPDPRIYQLICGELGVTPAETAFLDDIGVNLKAARALGMTTIKVKDPVLALEELERVLQTPA